MLVTQEHQVLKEEKQLQEEFKQFEKTERECFSSLSNAVRDSHEKERAQAEKTKYWSVLGSILGTCIGIFGTTINNRLVHFAIASAILILKLYSTFFFKDENERVKKACQPE